MSLIQALRTFALLAWVLFTFAFLFIAPIELYAVYRVRHWQPVKAALIHAETVQVHWRGLQEVPRYTFKDMENGITVTTGDIRPGDLPFSFSVLNAKTWSTERVDVARYKTSSEITVYRSPNGKDYFLEQGDYSFMSVVLAVCATYWAWVLTHLKKAKQQ